MAQSSPPGAPASPPKRLVVGYVNAMSGGQMGARVFLAAKSSGLDALHDLSDGGPRASLTLLADDAAVVQLVIICFGGDGTFNCASPRCSPLRFGCVLFAALCSRRATRPR